MTDIETKEPLEARAGLTWEWERQDLSDYPAPTWTLTYWFKQQATAGAKFSIVAAANGTYHRVDVAPSTTGAYTAGDYTWVAVVSDGTDSHQVDSGTLALLSKYNADAALDDRTHAKKALEAIEAVIEGRATKAHLEYSIAGRQIKFIEPDALWRWRARYKAEVAGEERVANGVSAGSKLVMRL